MEPLHRLLGYAVVVAVAAGIAWAIATLRNPALGGRSFSRFQVGVVVLIVASAIAGAGTQISGGAPKEDLHLVYGAIAIGALPLARSFVPAPNPRAGLATLAAFVAEGFAVYRLFVTG